MLFSPKHQAVDKSEFTITIDPKISEARTKRMPAKVNGGRSFKPILMKSQVDPQMQQRINQTMRAFISQLYVSETEWSKRESLNAKAAEDFANVSAARPSGRGSLTNWPSLMVGLLTTLLPTPSRAAASV